MPWLAASHRPAYTAAMPRFVLLFHQCPPGYQRPSHWDLMLEADGVLHTWALAELPCHWQAIHQTTLAVCGSCPPLATGDTVDADELADHRPAYLDYEGPVSGDRGSVTRVAAGTWDETDREADRLEFTLASPDIHGKVVLHRVQPGGTNWQLEFRPDLRSPGPA